TLLLFRLLGARRTRVVAQIASAGIGAAFAIGLQVAAILYYGTLNRMSLATSPALLDRLPDAASVLWWPARAILGNWLALAGVLLAAFALLAVVVAVFAPRLGGYSLA